ncbi:MAG: DUF2064 domain-containing protein [Flavobacteriaceae bacterium]|nr:DUF2064 domain-containing protein [Flavobacteriaceae bacterium]
MNQKTAILIFAQSASLECKNKYFPKGLELFSELNHQLFKKVKKTGQPYFIITEKEQNGATFGERFTNAIDFVFKKGFSNIITIGNDSPELNHRQLWQATLNLNESKTTIGPTFDGGFYLLSFHKSLFDKNAFLKLPWQKKSLRKELVKLLENNGALITTFRFYNDLDNINDTDYYLTHNFTITSEIFKLLQINLVSKPNVSSWNSIKSNFTSTSFNKGSPES